MKTLVLNLLFGALSFTGCSNYNNIEENIAENKSEEAIMDSSKMKSDKEWKEILTPEQYRVLREKGTDRAFTGKYDDFYEEGEYFCAACGAQLFTSASKYDAGCGWPSFWDANDSTVITKSDFSFGMDRTEILCANCGGHLGHVFNDGPKPTNERYCVNSTSIIFKKTKSKD